MRRPGVCAAAATPVATVIKISRNADDRIFCELERVPQGELHDSRIAGSRNLSERVAVEICVRVHRDEAVRQIEGLGSKFQFVGLPNLKDPRNRHIQLPVSRAFDAKRPHVSECTKRGLCKRVWIQVMRNGVAVAIRVSKYLVGPLTGRWRA